MPDPQERQDPAEQTEREVEQHAAASDYDTTTSREALETALMDDEESASGAHIGRHIE